MPRALDLRQAHHTLWERMVGHPFVLALGDGTLPRGVFADYMAQDYLFIDALARTVAYGVAKAPDLATAKPLGDFLHSLLGAEEAWFRGAFSELGVPVPGPGAHPLPATQRFSSFLLRVGRSGTFQQVATALYVSEGTYYDWATRLTRQGRQPKDTLYRGWIGLHADDALGRFVAFLSDCLEAPPSSPLEEKRLERVFTATLRHELGFWEAVYPAPARRSAARKVEP